MLGKKGDDQRKVQRRCCKTGERKREADSFSSLPTPCEPPSVLPLKPLKYSSFSKRKDNKVKADMLFWRRVLEQVEELYKQKRCLIN